jgi:phage gp37-like protein
VEFLVNEQWSDPYTFFNTTEIDTLEDETFYLDGVPSSIRFSLSGNDAWGIGQVTAWVDGCEEMILLCSTDGVTPSAGDNGHWIDGDSEINVPTTLTLVVEDNTECQTKFRLQALTGTGSYSDTVNDVYVEFLVNDQWSDPYMFFNTTEKDDLEDETFYLDGVPSSIRFSLSGNDAWGIGQVTAWVNGSEEMILLSTADGVTSIVANGLWIDGNSEINIPTTLTLDVEDNTECGDDVATVPPVDLSFNLVISDSDVDLTNSTWVGIMGKAVLNALGLSDNEANVQNLQIQRVDATTTVAAVRVRRVLQDDTVTYKVSMEVIIAPNTDVSTWDQMIENNLNDAVIEEAPQGFADFTLIVEEVSVITVAPTTMTTNAATTTSSSSSSDDGDGLGFILNVASNKYTSAGAAVASLVALTVRAY